MTPDHFNISLSPHTLSSARVIDLHVSQDEERPHEGQITLILDIGHGCTARFRFTGAQSLRLEGNWWDGSESFFIRDIAKRGMEGLRIEVGHDEQYPIFHFYAASVEQLND